MSQVGVDPLVAEGPIYWMRKFDALMTQASTAGLGLCLYKTYSIKKNAFWEHKKNVSLGLSVFIVYPGLQT